MIDVLLAAPELAVEPDLVRAAPSHGLRISRRCVDAASMLAAAAIEPATAVVVSPWLPRLTADVVERLAQTRRVIGLAGDDAARERATSLGIPVSVPVEATAEPVVAAIAAILVDRPPDRADVRRARDHADAGHPDRAGPDRAEAGGRLIAVWGPMGAPGRTTVALGVAESLASQGRRVLLVDADTYAPGITMALGVVEDVSGLLLACRHADAGTLSASSLATVSRRVGRGWHVLGGLPASERWRELRAGALDRVWAACRSAFDATVVDVGFCLEDDDGSGPWGGGRNAAARTAVAGADVVLAVADASGTGAARLVAAWPMLAGTTTAERVVVVRNRADVAGRGWRRAVGAGGVDAAFTDLPSDARSLERCWRQGRSLAEAAPRSRLRRALAGVATLAV